MTLSRSPLRTVRGVEVPVAGIWRVDPGHAEVGFWGRHFMLTKVRGRFTGVDATVTIADDPTDSTVEATIDMTSVDTGDQTRDDHLRSADLFDVENWPVARYRSTQVTWDGTRGRVDGDLTIRDRTRALNLDAEFLGALRDPWDNDRAVFSANGLINREDWGLTWNLALETGGILVSREIHLEFHVEMIRQT